MNSEIATSAFDSWGVGGLWSVGAAGITDFADQAVVLPLAAATFALFGFMRWWRGTIVWMTTIGCTLALILLLKLRFFACNHAIPEELVRNPSGHAAGAAVVYGSLAITMVRSVWNMKRALVPSTVAIAASIAFVIGASRLQLDKHSMPEVVVGGGIGVVGAILFVLLAGAPTHNLRPVRLFIVTLLVIAVFHGMRVSFEAGLEKVANDVRNILTMIDVRIC